MSQFWVGTHILLLTITFLARQSLGNPISSVCEHSAAMDPKRNSSDDPLGSIQMLYRPHGIKFTPYLASYWTPKNDDEGYYGLEATMEVYGHTLNEQQLSTGVIWLHSLKGDPNRHLNSIVAGWAVWPDHFFDSQTHFFVAWTRDNHGDTGCVDMECPGFQPVSGSPMYPGDIIYPPSRIDGERQNLSIKIFKDSSSGNWWVHAGLNSHTVPVGYFPASLFDSLSMKAQEIAVGGIAGQSRGVWAPPMGSGAFGSDSGRAASVWDIQLIDKNGKGTPLSDHAPRTKVTNDKLYSVSPITRGRFSFGGPGGPEGTLHDAI